MQLNPARGRKLDDVRLIYGEKEPVYAAQPREGTETKFIITAVNSKLTLLVYAAQPREGTETLIETRPMSIDKLQGGLCSSTPRGDGNLGEGDPRHVPVLGFMQLNPARGRKLEAMRHDAPGDHPRFMQLNPARGRKLFRHDHKDMRRYILGLCSSIPRGDGNWKRLIASHTTLIVGFMQLNPARGRKRGIMQSASNPWPSRFGQLNPARGRKRAHAPLSGHGAALDLYAHDDTPPCSSPVSAPHAQHISSFLMGGLW